MAVTRIGRILDNVGSIAFPGVFDALSARIAQRVGFPMAFVSGYSVAATAIGEPDMGLLTQTEMVERARQICTSVEIPIIVDADTGYGTPLNVYRTISQLIAAGAAGCFLEDQVWPKKCGHMRGKQVIPRDDYVQKIRAAAEARRGRDFFIVARTDALAVEGMDEAVARVEAARNAGADASFIEAPDSLERLEEIGRRSPAPNVANMIEGGKTPVTAKEELTRLGFQLILYPLSGLFAAARSIELMYQKLRTDGTTTCEEHRLMTFPEFNELIGVEEKYSQALSYRRGRLVSPSRVTTARRIALPLPSTAPRTSTPRFTFSICYQSFQNSSNVAHAEKSPFRYGLPVSRTQTFNGTSRALQKLISAFGLTLGGRRRRRNPSTN